MVVISKIYHPGEWIKSRVNGLTRDEEIQTIFENILVRTIGDASNDILFSHDAYYALDGIGRPEKAKKIGHWLCTEARLDRQTLFQPEMIKFVSEASLDSLWEHAKNRLNETGYTDTFPVMEDDESTIIEFENGFKLIEISHPEALLNEYEKSRLGGAVGPNSTNFILRDADDVSITIIGVAKGNIIGMEGADDRRVPFHITEAYLLPFIKERGYGLGNPTVIHEAVQTSDGKIYDLRDIPDGSTVNGNLMLYDDGKLISRMPDDLTVNGDFGLFNSVYIKETPLNLKATGSIGFVNCMGLKTIRSGLSAGEYCYFETCHNIQVIENDVSFGPGVRLSGELVKFSAKPFKADEIDFSGKDISTSLRGNEVPRNDDGLITIDGDFIKKALRREFQKELAKLPGLLVNVAYNEMTRKIRKGARSVKKALHTEPTKNDSDNPPKSPRM